MEQQDRGYTDRIFQEAEQRLGTHTPAGLAANYAHHAYQQQHGAGAPQGHPGGGFSNFADQMLGGGGHHQPQGVAGGVMGYVKEHLHAGGGHASHSGGQPHFGDYSLLGHQGGGNAGGGHYQPQHHQQQPAVCPPNFGGGFPPGPTHPGQSPYGYQPQGQYPPHGHQGHQGYPGQGGYPPQGFQPY